MTTEESAPGRVPLHTRILLGLVLGAVCGVAANMLGSDVLVLDRAAPHSMLNGVRGGWEALSGTPMLQPALPVRRVPALEFLVPYVMDPVGQIFLRMLLMTVVPLVFASLAVGVAKLGDLRDLGRIGIRTLAYFVLTMTIAVAIGLGLVNTVQPGEGMPAETREELLKTYAGDVKERQEKAGGSKFGIHTFVEIVPRNPVDSAARMDMLGVIFFALLVGISLNYIEKERGQLMLRFLEAMGDIMVFIIDLAMKLAPYGVFALIYATTARFGFTILQQLGWYVFVVILGLAIHFFGVFSLLIWTFSRYPPLLFFRKVRAVIVTAFSTSSSNATLPTSIKVSEEELGVPPPIAGFVLPLGATMNMNGTALYEGVTVVFLAQVFGVPLTFTDQLVVIVLSVLTAIGAAGVPGGSLPLLMMVLATVGVPASGIAIILGVDRILDMCRTTLNVIGDVTCATYIARSEGIRLPGAAPLSPSLLTPSQEPGSQESAGD